ncbi:MAG TPA: MerR family transcriptional regulator [Alphaproteobacteria bacterium]|nr:MerR family transcriptional regulator [Alphaproteobacteria bacterium]
MAEKNAVVNDAGNSHTQTRAQVRNGKSSEAFRTISEIAAELQLPQHVLRFWETKFTSLKPLKRGGGRRYYRPDDLRLLKRIRTLLYDDGYTIKGVQKLLRQPGALNNANWSGGGHGSKSGAGESLPEGGLGKKARGELEAVINDLENIRDGLSATETRPPVQYPPGRK